jgi:acetyl-CoA decarbonylase/synthase complex subunit gamma
LIIAAFVLLSGLGTDVYNAGRMLTSGGLAVALFLVGFLCGTVLGPALLPWLPGRAFSLKGLWIGLVLAVGIWLLPLFLPDWSPGWIDLVAWTFLLPVVTSFAVMNYTGSTTYTSLSGVRREMQRAVPLQAIACIVGISLWLLGRFV